MVFYGSEYLAQHPLIFALVHPHIQFSLSWIIQHKFELALAMLFMLAIILFSLLLLDWQRKNQVT